MDYNDYKTEIQSIKTYALNNNISLEEVDQIFEECFCLLSTKTSSRTITGLKLLKFIVLFSFFFISSFLILYNHPRTHNLLLRNLQSFIYPGLRMFRKLAIPVISTYPSLTEWYDEWCILENPYFRVHDMDCQPCNGVDSIKNFSNYNATSNSGIPLIRFENNKNFNINELFQLYAENGKAFDSYSAQVQLNQVPQKTSIDLKVNQIFDGKKHITWRINRMEIGRKLRKLFPKLPGVPNWWSPSTEKFVFIDKPNAKKYNLPNPECSNVIIQCVSGERMMQLLPSPECTHDCNKLDVLLTASQSLWYNWWYWRPESFPSNNSTNITITYLTSYC